ncbi:MAG: cupin domain-containing protein [Fimbriimonadaceae bacterium]|nr:cupin domain-containing protein [Alphaproteobacteria bacterium]
MKKPALDPSTLTQRIGTNYPAPFDQSVADRKKRPLTEALSLSQFGVNITDIPPGSASALRHWHTKEDEFVYVIAGEVTLVTGDGEQTLKTGMVAGFPAGVENGHCIQNRSLLPATILEVGTRHPEDEAHYPDNDLHAKKDREKGHIFSRKDGSLFA